jgi:hypothetical protein
MPLAIVANIAFWAYAAFVLLYVPVTFFGVAGAGGGYLTVALIVGAICLCFYAKKKLEAYQREKRWEAERAAGMVSNEAKVIHNEDKGPGFIEVVWLYLVSMKQKVCPTIQFRTVRTQEGS